MGPYYNFLLLVFTHGRSSRFHLENLERGKFKDLIDECLAQKYIMVCGKNKSGDALYSITSKGRQIIDGQK